MVDRRFAQTEERQVGQRDLGAHRDDPGAVPCRRRPQCFEPFDRGPQAGHLLVRRPGRAGFDVGLPPFEAVRVLATDLAAGRRFEDEGMAVTAVGDMGDHVADRPTRQRRRCPHVELVGDEQAVEIVEQPPMGGRRHGDVAVEVAPVELG